MSIKKRIKTTLINKHDTEENWLKATGFIPEKGQIIIYDPDINHNYARYKIGDGVLNTETGKIEGTNIIDLPFVNGIGSATAENGEIFNLYKAQPDDYDTRTTITTYYEVALSFSEDDLEHTNPIFTKTDTILEIDEETLANLPDEVISTPTTTGETVYAWWEMSTFYCVVETLVADEDKNQAYNEALANYSHAEGYDTTTLRRASHVEGTKVTAFGTHSHGEGYSSNNIHRLKPEWTRDTANDEVIAFWEETKFQLAKGSPSHVEGSNNLALGNDSHAEGGQTIANSFYAHSEGMNTKADGEAAHAEGRETIAKTYAHAEGWGSKAQNAASHAEGRGTIAEGLYSHVEGLNTNAVTTASHAEGEGSKTNGQASHAEGYKTETNAAYAHAEGNMGRANGWASHAEGNGGSATGDASHAEGHVTTASGSGAHAEGHTTTASSIAAHAEGQNTVATAAYAHSEGYYTTASGQGSHAEGGANSGTTGSTASGKFSHAEGDRTLASALGAHAEGQLTSAAGQASHSEGLRSKAIGIAAHAEGYGIEGRITEAKGVGSHAEGYGTKTYSNYSHTEGQQTRTGEVDAEGKVLSGIAAHAEGYLTDALGDYSHTEGKSNIAAKEGSHVGGLGNTSTMAWQRVIGTYSQPSTDSLFTIGNGTSDSARANAFEVLQDGRARVQSAPAEDMDVVNKKYSDEVYANKQELVELADRVNILDPVVKITGNPIMLNDLAEDVELIISANINKTNPLFVSSNPTYDINTSVFKTGSGGAGDVNFFEINYENGNIIYNNSNRTKVNHNYMPDGIWDVEEPTNEILLYQCNIPNLNEYTTIDIKAQGTASVFTTNPYATDDYNRYIDNRMPLQDFYYKIIDTTLKIYGKFYSPVPKDGGVVSDGENNGAYTTNITISLSKTETLENCTICTDNSQITPYIPSTSLAQFTNNPETGEENIIICEYNKNNQEPIGVGQTTEQNGEIFNLYEQQPDDYDNTGVNVAYNEALANYSHAEGYDTTALRRAGHVEGTKTVTFGTHAHAEGYSSNNIHRLKPEWTRDTSNNEVIAFWEETKFQLAKGSPSHVEGSDNLALVNNSHAEGGLTIAADDYAHAEGHRTKAYGQDSHAEGIDTQALAPHSHAEGEGSISKGQGAHAEGYKSTSSGNYAHSEGQNTGAYGTGSHSEGIKTEAGLSEMPYVVQYENYYDEEQAIYLDRWIITNTAYKYPDEETRGTLETIGVATTGETVYYWSGTIDGMNPPDFFYLKPNYTSANHAEGSETKASGTYSHAEGYKTKAIGQDSHAEGISTEAKASHSHAEGEATIASGQGSHTEGQHTQATTNGAHAEGGYTIAGGMYTHSEGYNTQATSYAAHAEGNGSSATAEAAHAEGKGTTASGLASHAEGRNTVASGSYSHAEGDGCQVTAGFSHVEGYNNILKAPYSHVNGGGNKVEGHANSCGGGDTTMTAAARYSFSHGQGNNIAHQYVATLGRGLKSDRNYQFLAGAYNAPNANAIVAIGNGTNDSSRTNAFEVLKDGRAVIQTAPVNDMDVANKAYVDNSIANISGNSGLTITNRETVSINCPQVTFDGNTPQWLHTVYNNGDEEYELLTPYTSYNSGGGPWADNTFNNMSWNQIGSLAIDFSNFTHIIVSGNGNLWAEYNGVRIPYTISGFKGEQLGEDTFGVYGYGYIPSTIDNISTGYGRPEMDVINLTIKLIK